MTPRTSAAVWAIRTMNLYEPTGGVFALATDPTIAAFGWLWLRDEVLAPMWRAGSAGKQVAP